MPILKFNTQYDKMCNIILLISVKKYFIDDMVNKQIQKFELYKSLYIIIIAVMCFKAFAIMCGTVS